MFLPDLLHSVTSAVPVQVALPSALIHGSASNDPRVKELQEELNTVNKKILDNELDIPPEGQRSPSPEPVYDRNGIRLNTREVRGRWHCCAAQTAICRVVQLVTRRACRGRCKLTLLCQ